MNATKYILPKIKLSIALAAFVALITYVVIGQTTEAASTDCFKTSTANASIKVVNGKAVANFTIPKNCGPKSVTIVSYKAPNGTDGKPYPKQTVHTFNTKTFAKSSKAVNGQMSVDLPNCFYQVDLIRGDGDNVIHKFAAGNTYTEHGRMITAKHGGDKSCNPPAPAPAPAAAAPAAPSAPAATPAAQPVPDTVILNENVVVNNVSTAPAPAAAAPVAQTAAATTSSAGKSLPNTGPGDFILPFSFTFTFLSSMIVSYRSRFSDLLGSFVARF